MQVIKKTAILAVIGFAVFFLQTTFIPKIAIASVTPNLLVITAAVAGAILDTKSGMIMGFLCGVWCDIFYSSVFGIYALIYALVGFSAGLIKKKIFDEDINLPVLILIFSDLVYGGLMYGFFFFLRGRFSVLYYLSHVIIPEAVYTGIIGIAIYRIFLYIENRNKIMERRSANKFV